MSQYFRIHPENPQMHLLTEAVMIIRNQGVVVYPTDSAYAIGCMVGEKEPMKRIRQIRELNDDHHFTLMCRDLSELALYARVSNKVFRILKAFTPGPYTFILPATKEVPRRLQHPKRKTIGLRVPEHIVTQALLEALEAPLISTTLTLPGQKLPMIEPEAMREVLGKRVDLILDGGYSGVEETSVIDLVEDTPKVLRFGKGDVSLFI